jgi:putative ABC transport system permease protein
MMNTVQRFAAEADPKLTAMAPATLDSYSSVPFLPVRMASGVLTFLGFGALVLATLGLYAVMGYAVAQRQREIGIRMALGAAPGQLVRRFLGSAGVYVGLGALAGMVIAFAIIRVLLVELPGSIPEQLGSQIGPFLTASALLGAVALVAAFIPANRASRVSPTVALREE